MRIYQAIFLIDFLLRCDNRINTAAKSNVDCTAGATAAETTIGVNTLTTDSDDDCYHAMTFQGTHVNIDTYLLEMKGKDPSELGFENFLKIVKETKQSKFSDIIKGRLYA